ncbi:WYL domain-containing protein [Brevibacillus sp. SYP-B805]|uniref:WYL domain-containing protein n=1 Tax=Brevibacillus sp. SYP-B805 TaxID=1578199 RepID=UPI0019D28834|nr:WYL domain-containing protein [Brevibacillus sp. SYP-B805]
MIRRDLQRFFAAGERIDIIYLDRRGQVTKRMLRILGLTDSRLKAYCYTRRAPRVFDIANILAVSPAQRRAAGR